MALTQVQTELIATNAISGTVIADNAITSVHIAQNAILTQHIDDGQVNTDQLAADAVTGAKLADSSIVTANIQDDQVTSDKLANNINIAGTLASTGVLTANAGVVVDNITIDGTEIDLSSGDLTLDVAGDITLDADGGDWIFSDAGTTILGIHNVSSDAVLKANVNDKDMIFKGTDNNSEITALTLDMSDAGTAIFNHDIKLGDDDVIKLGDTAGDFELYHIAGSVNVIRGNGGLVLQTDDTSYGIQMGSTSGGETMFKAVKDGAVTLYYDNSAKLATTSTGVTISDDLLASGLYVGSINTSYDFYNNGTSYLNGAVTIDDDLTITNATARSYITSTGAGNNAALVLQADSADTTAENGGVYYVASDTADSSHLSLSGDNANYHLSVTHGGKVGIGTTSPTDELELKGDTYRLSVRSADQLLATLGNWGNSGADIDEGHLAMYSSGTETVRLATNADSFFSGGNVGIGTESPAQGLHLASGKQARFDDHVSIQPTKRLYIDGGGDTFIEETAANEMTFTTANAERMRINTTGVGIGTASPAGVLDIPSGSYSATKPAIMLGGDIDTTGAGSRTDNTRKYSSIVGYHYSNEEQPIGIMAYDCQSDSVAIINYGIPSGNYNAPTVHRWHTASNATTTAGTERMRINDAGNIGVGLTNPSGRVHSYVADNDKALSADGVGRVNLTVQSSETGGKIWYFRTAGTGNYGSGAGDLHVLNEAGTAITTWDYSASTFNGDLNDTSDVALKENITDITDATTKIKALKPRNFDWKESTKANGVDGFIAQEVETVLPNNVVGENYDSDNPEHGSKAINTSGILAVAVKAIQELEARIKTLEDA